jgi:hypothetical protein
VFLGEKEAAIVRTVPCGQGNGQFYRTTLFKCH